MKEPIYEVAVYCGRLKEWRVLNLTTGTVYSLEHSSLEEANAGIEDGEIRVGRVVKRVTLAEIREALNRRQ